MGSYRRNLKPIISIIFILLISSRRPLAAARPLEGEWGSKKAFIVLESLQKGPGAPSGRSSCTYVSKTPGPPCVLNERNFAVHASAVGPGSHDTITKSGVSFADTEIQDQHPGS
ncbi:hypothetical protein AAC387_Pa01g3530 [Persea americana]